MRGLEISSTPTACGCCGVGHGAGHSVGHGVGHMAGNWSGATSLAVSAATVRNYRTRTRTGLRCRPYKLSSLGRGWASGARHVPSVFNSYFERPTYLRRLLGVGHTIQFERGTGLRRRPYHSIRATHWPATSAVPVTNGSKALAVRFFSPPLIPLIMIDPTKVSAHLFRPSSASIVRTRAWRRSAVTEEGSRRAAENSRACGVGLVARLRLAGSGRSHLGDNAPRKSKQ